MNSKHLLLLGASVVFIVLFFNIEVYKNWKDNQLLQPSISYQLAHMSKNDRMHDRYFEAWDLSVAIHGLLDTAADRGKAVILLPPNSYIKSQKLDLDLPEPATFYYLDGLKMVWTNSPNVMDANYAIIVVPGTGINCKKLSGKNELLTLLETYKNFKPGL